MNIFLDILYFAYINIAQKFLFSLPDNIKLADTAFFFFGTYQKIFSLEVHMGYNQFTQFLHPDLPETPVFSCSLLPGRHRLPLCASQRTEAGIPGRRRQKRLP